MHYSSYDLRGQAPPRRQWEQSLNASVCQSSAGVSPLLPPLPAKNTKREPRTALRSVIALKMSHHAEWLQSHKHTCIHPGAARAIFQTCMHTFLLICNDTHEVVFVIFFFHKMYCTRRHFQHFYKIVSVSTRAFRSMLGRLP